MQNIVKNPFWVDDMILKFSEKFNTEPFENCILGTLLIDESHYSLVKQFVKPQMFSSKNKSFAGLIFEMLECFEPLKKYIILERASQNKVDITSSEIDQIRYQASETELENSIFQLTKNWYSYNKAISALQFVSQIEIGTDVLTATAVMEKKNEEIEFIKESYDENKHDFKQQVKDCFDSIKAKYENPNLISGISSGFVEFDMLTGGFLNGNLYALGGESGGGKSTLALQMVSHAATKGNTDFYSLEMSARQIIPKLFSAKTGIHTIRLNLGNVSSAEIDTLSKVSEQVQAEFNFKIIDDLFHIDEIRKSILQRAKRANTNLIIIDHLGIIQSNSKSSTNEKYDDIAYDLKIIAKKINVPIILLAQRNADFKNRANKYPVTSDLKYGGAAACDAVIFPHKVEIELDESQKNGEEVETKIVITKNREGMLGDINTIFVSRFNSYCEIDDNGRPILPTKEQPLFEPDPFEQKTPRAKEEDLMF